MTFNRLTGNIPDQEQLPTLASTMSEKISSSEKNVGSFGRELYRLRTERLLTEATVAFNAGLSRGYYSQVENSRKGAPPKKTVERILSALNLLEDEQVLLREIADAERNEKYVDVILKQLVSQGLIRPEAVSIVEAQIIRRVKTM